MDKIGKYNFIAGPFHCDMSQRLFMGYLVNDMLNAADFHSDEHGYGVTYMNSVHKAWVISRLAVEMIEMPPMYTKFHIETWVESAMRYFTNRNFSVVGNDGKVYGYGRFVWALIDTDTRQPADINAIMGDYMSQWLEKEKPCPIARSSRVKISEDAQLVRTLDTTYTDVDVNGHINSVKYIDHVLDLWNLEWYKNHTIRRVEVAYVSEGHQGDRLAMYLEQTGELEYSVRIMKVAPDTEEAVEACRCLVAFNNC
jgi:acyl-ACP thioesterase